MPGVEFFNTIVVGALIAAAAGILGAFAVLKRMTLAGDVLSHVALPGIGLALFFGIPSMWGATVALLGAAVAVWAIRNRTHLPEETVIGVLFAMSLAFGILATPGEELIDALFGGLENISFGVAVFIACVAVGIILLMAVLARRIVLSTISPELAQASGLRPDILELLFLLSFGAVIALGVKFTGTLLMGALIIVPAAAAKNISRSLTSFVLVSMGFSVIAMTVGFVIAQAFGILPGPVAILLCAPLFLITMAFRWR